MLALCACVWRQELENEHSFSNAVGDLPLHVPTLLILPRQTPTEQGVPNGASDRATVDGGRPPSTMGATAAPGAHENDVRERDNDRGIDHDGDGEDAVEHIGVVKRPTDLLHQPQVERTQVERTQVERILPPHEDERSCLKRVTP